MKNLDNDNSQTCAHVGSTYVSALNPGFLIISHKHVNMGNSYALEHVIEVR